MYNYKVTITCRISQNDIVSISAQLHSFVKKIAALVNSEYQKRNLAFRDVILRHLVRYILFSEMFVFASPVVII